MKKTRFFCFILIFIMLLSPCPVAFADIAIIPDSDFLREHGKQCTNEFRNYTSNGSEGYVLVYDEPLGKPLGVLPNGRSYRTELIWKDGEHSWVLLCCDLDEPEALQGSDYVWAEAASMYVIYDEISFWIDRADSIIDKSQSLMVPEGEEMLMYYFPGSGEIVGSCAPGTVLNFCQEYTDAQGRVWLCEESEGNWLCISDPHSILEAEEPPPVIIPPADDAVMAAALREARGTGTTKVILAVSLVIIAAVICAYIIIRRRKRA